MTERDCCGYEEIVGEIQFEEYLGPERQGELLKRCTILENVEIGYSGSTSMNEISNS